MSTPEWRKNYCKRIESGSIVATLVPTVEQMTWLWEHRGDVAGFVTHIKDIAEYLLGSAPVAKALIGKKEIERTAQIVEPVAKDNGAQFNISARDNSRVIVNYIMDKLTKMAIRQYGGVFACGQHNFGVRCGV